MELTEQWLRDAGFKWHQLDRQPHKHWVLWLGRAIHNGDGLHDSDDFGVELAKRETVSGFYLWFRADYTGRYSRLLFARYVETVDELLAIIEALTGVGWDPANCMYGMLHTPEMAARLRKESERLDLAIARQQEAIRIRHTTGEYDEAKDLGRYE